MNNLLVKLDGVKAPMPFMHPDAAKRFDELRAKCIWGAGFDFLAICGDVCRAADFVSSKDGVANRSWHKTGRAFDYNQDDKNLVIVSEIIGGKQYFRTYLKCDLQDGKEGEFLRVKDYRGFYVSAYLFDFTAAAESVGFERIPAWNGWKAKYNRREYWHYQFTGGLSWDAAMLQLRGKAREEKKTVLGLNDRGEQVRELQRALNRQSLLPAKEIDGVFGSKTLAALKIFQKQNGLISDGLFGDQSRALLMK